MHVADGLHVVVRLLPSSGLEGAFRVHVLPESLLQAGLKVGDVCAISSEDGSNGFGIAWRADDRMGTRPKNRPAKMTETIRSAFGFEEGSTVTIAKTDAKIFRADRIVLSDVTPPEYNKSDDGDDGCWKLRTAHLFSACIEFDANLCHDADQRCSELRSPCSGYCFRRSGEEEVPQALLHREHRGPRRSCRLSVLVFAHR